MHRATVDLYEREAKRYALRRRTDDASRARAFARSRVGDGPVLDAGCGPGLYLPLLGPHTVALDAAAAMVDLARDRGAEAPVVQADLVTLPFRSGALAGAWARQSYLHLARAELPAALADLHRSLAVGAPLALAVLEGPGDGWRPPNDDFPGRFFAGWEEGPLVDVVTGAGFSIQRVERDRHKLWVWAVRERSLADTVGAGMRVLVCGLNPSLHAADAGVGYAGPGNRFWPAAVGAGLVAKPFDAGAALADGVGMTDLVKRATARATEVSVEEFRDGVTRVARLVEWLAPKVVCFVGLVGYRAAVQSSRAAPGWQAECFGGVRTYLMPSTSALNARTRYNDVVAHLRAVVRETR